MPKPGGTIYAVEAVGTGLVKIGYTTGTLDKRVKTLQTGQPFPLRVIATQRIAQDARQTEAWLHAFLKKERRRGEWFELALEPEAFAELIARAINFGAEQEAQRQTRLDQQRCSMSLGKEVKKARIDKGLTQAAVQAQIGISQKHLSQIEKDHVHPSWEIMARLAVLLDLDLNALAREEALHA